MTVPVVENSRLRRAREVEFRRIEDDGYVLRLAGDTTYLQGVASDLWRLLDGTRTIGEVSAEIVRTYAVEESAAHADTVEFCAGLLERGFLCAAD